MVIQVIKSFRLNLKVIVMNKSKIKNVYLFYLLINTFFSNDIENHTLPDFVQKLNRTLQEIFKALPGQSPSAVNGRTPIIYDGKRQQFTVTVYDNCKRCCTVHYDNRKQ